MKCPAIMCFALTVASLVTACASTAPKPRLVAFDPADSAPYEGVGPGTLEGQAFLVTAGGDVKVGAGRRVWLIPATKYWTEWYERTAVAGEVIEPAAREVPRAKDTIADAEGRFRFTELPLGDYYVGCWIDWQITQYSRSGGMARAAVSLKDSRPVSAIVTIR